MQMSCHPTHAMHVDCWTTFIEFNKKNGGKLLCPTCRAEVDPKMCQEVENFDPRKSTINVQIDREALQREMKIQDQLAENELVGLP